MNEKQGIITFDRYEVNEINFKLNPDYNGEEVEVDMNVNAEFKTNNSGQNLIAQLYLDIFPNATQNMYPFEIHLTISGYFTGQNNMDVKNYEANALAILFPYARSIITTYTASANVTPLILPTININKMLKHASKKIYK